MMELLRIWLSLMMSCQLVYGNWGDVASHADPTSTMIVVSRDHKAPAAAPAVVLPNITPSQDGVAENLYLRPEAAAALEQMFQAAQVDGHVLYGVSGYRSAGSQAAIYERRVGESGDSAKRFVAPGGYSEHQTGFVMDITGESSRSNGLVQSFGDTPEGIWVAENAHRFGFIIRYQKGWEQITGYSYEPWHLRYVGIEHATRIYELALPLEYYAMQLQREEVETLMPEWAATMPSQPVAPPIGGATPVPTDTPAPTETPVPTLAATQTPPATQVPTPLPSPTPKAKPATFAPIVPTQVPTARPTIPPTQLPTQVPTPVPTMVPTLPPQ